LADKHTQRVFLKVEIAGLLRLSLKSRLTLIWKCHWHLFDSGRRQKKQALVSTKPDFSSLPEVKNLLLAAQKQLIKLTYSTFWSFIAIICDTGVVDKYVISSAIWCNNAISFDSVRFINP
jgi:hypothetical protein